VSNNNNWSEIGKDISENLEKISKKLNEKNVTEDLKQSFKETIGQASNVIKQIVENIEITITDEEIKTETKKIIQDIIVEFESNVSNAGKKLADSLNFRNQEEE